MINTKDFRIGNLVEILGEVEEITGVIRFGLYFKNGYCQNLEDWIKPILLSEDWIKDSAGFDKIYESSFQVKYELIVDRSTIVIAFHSDTSICVYLNNVFVKEIKYVHQLQNIYYDLQGEELPIKS